ncbi:PAS domain-containing protein [Noviherbaspirillum sp.]|uniref:PAS domain-containing protein n=1 Tax=Noviherbaspirillum sp. TaxID=1926288 RepID=UPI002B46690E|nr:PAS domain-containing protein [Noviherbaspirillum sp.]HJV80193.1 PAS domain-containing protein [Noviherbaspirillum sp.]
MFDEIPVVELVGVTSNKSVSPQSLAELKPDLLLLNPAPDQDGRRRLFDYLSQHLPRCKTVILSKPSEKEPCDDKKNRHAKAKIREGYASAVIDPDDQTHIRAEIQKSILEKNIKNTEPRHTTRGNAVGYLYDYIESMSNDNQRRTFSGVVHDITERRRRSSGRRQAELNRAKSVARLQSFVEQLPGMPYIAQLNNADGNIYVSPRIEELLGFSPQQWCSNPDLRIRQLHPADREKVLQAIRHAIETRNSYLIDYRIFRRDDGMRWFHDEGRVIVDDDGKPLFLQGAIIDITERKQAQEELERSHGELQELITALDTLRVEEQRRLAHEMHDDFGQLLAAMKLDLCTLKQHLSSQDSEAVKYLGSINDLVDAMVTSVRRILADLPPKMVDDLGLFNALRAMARNFEKRHQLACDLEFSGLEPELDPKVATALFRMAQEALNNVAKHACATLVWLRIDCDTTSIALTVRDDGRGLQKACLHKPGSFGLIGMQERASALGGEMKIESGGDHGTTIKIVIPLRAQAAPTC